MSAPSKRGVTRIRGLVDVLRANYFVVPTVAVVIAFIGGRVAVSVDVGDWAGDATVESARAVLSIVAAATITFASIVFSVALLIMQQGSSQYSPRVIPGLTRDPFNRRVIALVLGTFTYCLVVLQRVHGPVDGDGEAVAPRLAVAIGLVLGVAAVLAVAGAIHHTAQQMDVSKILQTILDQAQRSLGGVDAALQRSDSAREPAGPASVVRFVGDGWVQRVDGAAVLAAAPRGTTVRLDTAAGRYAVRATSACTIWPPLAGDDLERVEAAVGDAIQLGTARTMVEDRSYAVRQLVDVALRSLSSGVNDPTTAYDALCHLGTLLVVTLQGPRPTTALVDAEGRRLLTPHALSDAGVADLAFGEIRRAGASMPTVCGYVFEVIAQVERALQGSPAADRAEPFRHQALLMLVDAERAISASHDRQAVRAAFTYYFGQAPTASVP